jgi:hypothetical protein
MCRMRTSHGARSVSQRHAADFAIRARSALATVLKGVERGFAARNAPRTESPGRICDVPALSDRLLCVPVSRRNGEILASLRVRYFLPFLPWLPRLVLRG